MFVRIVIPPIPGKNALPAFIMNFSAVFVAAFFLAGCSFTQPPSKTDEETRVVLKRAFEKEDHFPPERDVLKLRDHAWNLEMMLRSVQLDADKDRVLAALRRYFKKHRKHPHEAATNLDTIVAETGCSKALLSVLHERTQGINFAFFENDKGQPNPRYRYSRTILNERVIYPQRTPFTIQAAAHPRNELAR